jgi:hypothetical protein
VSATELVALGVDEEVSVGVGVPLPGNPERLWTDEAGSETLVDEVVTDDGTLKDCDVCVSSESWVDTVVVDSKDVVSATELVALGVDEEVSVGVGVPLPGNPERLWTKEVGSETLVDEVVTDDDTLKDSDVCVGCESWVDTVVVDSKGDFVSATELVALGVDEEVSVGVDVWAAGTAEDDEEMAVRISAAVEAVMGLVVAVGSKLENATELVALEVNEEVSVSVGVWASGTTEDDEEIALRISAVVEAVIGLVVAVGSKLDNAGELQLR